MSGAQSFYHRGNIVLPIPLSAHQIDVCVLHVTLFNSSFKTDVAEEFFTQISKSYFRKSIWMHGFVADINLVIEGF